MVLVKWPYATSVELVWSYSLMVVHDLLMPAAQQKCSGCDANSNAYCVIHAANLSDHDSFTALNTSRPGPHKTLSNFVEISKRHPAKTLAFP